MSMDVICSCSKTSNVSLVIPDFNRQLFRDVSISKLNIKEAAYMCKCQKNYKVTWGEVEGGVKWRNGLGNCVQMLLLSLISLSSIINL